MNVSPHLLLNLARHLGSNLIVLRSLRQSFLAASILGQFFGERDKLWATGNVLSQDLWNLETLKPSSVNKFTVCKSRSLTLSVW